MITLRFQIVDFMDQRPLPQAVISVMLEVYPLFLSPAGIDGEGEPIPERPEPDFSQSVEVTGEASTDDQGEARVDVDTTETFAQLSEARNDEGRRAISVAARCYAAITFIGAEYERKWLTGGLVEGDDREFTLPVDLGMSIVGHTTPTSTRLWFHLPFTPTEDQVYRCAVFTEQKLAPTDSPVTPVEPGVVFTDPQVVSTEHHTLLRGRLGDIGGSQLAGSRSFPVDDWHKPTSTVTVDVDQLAPGHLHQYTLLVQLNALEEFSLIKGSFSTPAEQSGRLSFAFGSCHLPTVGNEIDATNEVALQTLNRWQRLADRRDYEFLLLIGDQIYGDGIEDKWPSLGDLEQYVRRYQQLWVYRPMREVLRNVPTYMILDDHDIADDFGTGDLDDIKVAAGLESYFHFQHKHNPVEPEEPDLSIVGPFHYHFRWGPAAFFVMDGRTQRGKGVPATPVFGAQQLADLEAWAASAETRAADVIFFVAPVPLALLPSETIRAIVEELPEDVAIAGGVAGGGAGILVGAGVGALVAGPLGAAVGAGIGGLVFGAAGYSIANEVTESYVDRSNLLLDFDLAERWDLKENQPDLVRLLDILFGLANSIGDETSKPRAVFILSGDIHAGTMHAIRALPAANGPDYSRNRVIMQLTSSAISHEPVNNIFYASAVSQIDDDFDISWKDILDTALFTRNIDDLGDDVDDLLASSNGAFRLDPDEDGRFLAQFAGLVMERTVGRVEVEMRDPSRREYRFGLRIEGENNTVESRFDLNLDAPLVSPIRDDAEIVSISAPSEVQVGATFDVAVDVRNTGISSWEPGRYILDIADELWGVEQVELPERVTSDRTASFRFQLRAPGPGAFPFTCYMARRVYPSSRFQRFGQGGSLGHVITVLTNPDADACTELRDRKQYLERLMAALRQDAYEAGEPSEELMSQIQVASQQLSGVEAELDRLDCV